MREIEYVSQAKTSPRLRSAVSKNTARTLSIPGVKEGMREIKRLTNRVNEGENVDADYEALRAAQKRLAALITVHPKKTTVSVALLNVLDKRDFPYNYSIIVRDYGIKCEGMHTTAWRLSTFMDLNSRTMPQFLRIFIGL